jgi:hypothetical protein
MPFVAGDEVASTSADAVVPVRRSAGGVAAWFIPLAAIAMASLAGLGYAVSEGDGAGIVAGALLALLFTWLAVAFGRRLFKPRDLFRIGPDGIEQLAVRPHGMLRWDEITDLRVVNS